MSLSYDNSLLFYSFCYIYFWEFNWIYVWDLYVFSFVSSYWDFECDYDFYIDSFVSRVLFYAIKLWIWESFSANILRAQSNYLLSLFSIPYYDAIVFLWVYIHNFSVYYLIYFKFLAYLSSIKAYSPFTLI